MTEAPFLVISNRGSRDGKWIDVFKLASDELIEDLNTDAQLIKTVKFPGFYADKLLNNGLWTGG